MINFRFHLVSLVAVFLALTVGIVVGASVVNRAIVDGLNNRLDTVGRNADKQRDENRLLSKNAKQLETYLETAAPYVVEGRLTAVPVVVVAERGVDRGTVRALVTLLHDSGAQTPAIVWLQSKWLLDKPEDRTALAGIIGEDPASAELRTHALDAFAHRLGTAVSSRASATTTTNSARQPDLLGALASAGFVSIEAVGASGTTDLSTFPAPGARAVVVSGEASDFAASPLVASPLVATLASEFSNLPVPTIATEIYRPTDGRPARGTVVGAIRDDGTLSKSVSTVDDLDLVQGQVAVVLAVANAAESKVGHYGYGSGAEPLPAWSGP